MIKDKNISDAAAIQAHKIMGPGQVGEIFWVATIGTQSYDQLIDKVNSAKLFTTLEEANENAVAARGDIIFMAPNHTETVAAAAAINLNKTGVSVVGLGNGAAKPTFTFSATASTITMTAANVELKNIIVVPSIDSVVSPIVVSAADCTVHVEVQDASDTVECVNAILTTADADRIDIDVKYIGDIAGDACVNAVRLVGVDTARINVDFYGVASTSIVEFHTTACHNIVISGKFYNDGTSLTKNVVDTVTGSTWSATGWDGNSNANFGGGDNSALATDDTSAVATDVTTVLSVLSGAAGIAAFPVAAAAANDVSLAEVVRYIQETQLAVAEVTGDADVDISEADYTGYINVLTVTAPATGLANCVIDIDFNKATTGWDNVATAADVLDCVLVKQIDGTNYRSTQNASAQITANGNGTLDASESGMSFNVGPMQANASVQVHVKMDTERDDCELPYRVTYVGAAPTVTPVATA